MSGTFLLGVGAQKGGTAWLHRYLADSPQFDGGFRKEYHVWDALDLPSGRLVRERIEAQGGPRAELLADPERYFDYFTSLLEPPAVRLTADITPAYAELPVARLAAVRDGFATRGVRPAAVFLMRDPVERVWSAARMDMRRLGEAAPEPAEVRISHMYHHPMYAEKTRYDLTIDALEQVFSPDQVFYGLYERLFSADTLRPFCAFAGIDYHEPDPDRRVNESPKTVELPEETVRTIARHFAPVYAAVAARFPDVDLAALWPSARHL
ncbi:sulfotransferase [Nocardioides flavescens]|uniref:Sulfotransferase family protein n=1 Tax=Nocardioides flavescens TaxID=2691959 RepID=A0A6L7ESL5_9ACTN|nr:sulfotransferase [Nocardioides flavescens]MXG88546.1 sulfotransferase family protein [Nocardioides flavescens]